MLEVTAEQYGRRANQLEQERAQYNAIYDDISRKYTAVKDELETTLNQLENI